MNRHEFTNLLQIRLGKRSKKCYHIFVDFYLVEDHPIMRKLTAILSIFLLLCSLASAEEPGFSVAPEVIHPGKAERLSFASPAAGEATLSVVSADGQTVYVIREAFLAAQGINHLSWDGLNAAGEPLPVGDYVLTLSISGQTAIQPLQIGEPSPQILSIRAGNTVEASQSWRFTVSVNMAGTLVLRAKMEDGWQIVMEKPIQEGETTLEWDVCFNGRRLADGQYAMQFYLVDSEGFSGTIQQVSLTCVDMVTPAPSPTPKVVIPSAVTTPAQETNYWTLPMGVMDEQAIWDVMMQPITVIEGDQREVYRLRKNPDNSSSKDNIVGEITYASQGLHILETRDDGWTLVEAFNSSYGPNCASRRGYGVTDDLIRGYVKTSLLKTITPRTDYALLVDKLTQQMYIFSDGKCIGKLLVSTGLNNAKQSWNETPSGEFLMVSRMGGFPAGNLWCAYGMRINGGCAIHEVPYIGDADTPAANRDYSSTIKLLGKKASHGCIRVQKAANDQGQNIKWLWDNIKVNTKVLIWDDTGRFMEYPPDDTPVYYNPNGGKNYHEDQYCSAVKSRYLPLTKITYGELNTIYSNLTPCPSCTRLMLKYEIDALNRENGF